MEQYNNPENARLSVSSEDSKMIIEVSNNRAQYFADLAKKYKNEAKIFSDNAKYYAEQNSNVTFEYVTNMQTALQEEIDKKQNSGDYALRSEIPESVSAFINDSEYVTKGELSETASALALPEKQNCSGKFLQTDGNQLNWADIKLNNLFDIKISEHILLDDESFGWALTGTYVYKDVVSGYRCGYPDFYAKCLEEKNSGEEKEITLGNNKITAFVNSNGHIYYDISDKNAVDEFYNTYGVCWMYGIDIENERVFLPRNNWFFQAGTTSEAGTYVETVQPKSDKVLVYICVGNTVQRTSITDVIDITSSENDTIPLGYSMYQGDNAQPSVAWLASNGQWNSGKLYETFYNNYVPLIGQKFAKGYVRNHTDEYTDYDLVINQDDMTFRLPLLNGSESLLSKKQVILDRNSHSSTTATTATTVKFYIPVNASVFLDVNLSNGSWAGLSIPASEGGIRQFAHFEQGTDSMCFLSSVPAGTTVHLNYSGSYTVNSWQQGLYYVPLVGNGSLYYYVGETVQNANLIDAGRFGEALATKADAAQAAHAAMPSNKHVDLSIAFNSPYIAPADGMFVFDAQFKGSGHWLILRNNSTGEQQTAANTDTRQVTLSVSAKKGDAINIGTDDTSAVVQESWTNGAYFIYAEGAK